MTSLLPGLYLAFDYGDRHIGIASGHSQTGTTSPLAVVRNNSGTPTWRDVDHLINKWQPVGFVIGIPLHMEGNEQALTAKARGFGKRLQKRYGLPVHEADERLTTRQAGAIIKENRMRGKRRKTSKADLDKIAAALILQKWFEDHNERNR